MLSQTYDFLESRTRAAGAVRLMMTLVAVLLFWQAATTYVIHNRLLLVPPMDVFRAARTEVITGALWSNTLATIGAVAASFPVAVAIGIGIGLALSSSRLLAMTAGPLFTAINSMPVVALAPLFIAGLGLGFASKFAIVTLFSLFPVLVMTEVGLKATDKVLVDAARSFNASPRQVFTTVTLPFALPFIISGVRIAWARALVAIIVAEFFGAFAGFGFAILAAGQSFDTATLLAYVILLGLLGLLGSIFFEWLERRLAPWRQE